MYLHLRELDLMMSLWDKMRAKETFRPNQMLLNTLFECSLRLNNSDRIFDVLQEYVDQKKEPPRFLLQKISHVKDLPDRLFVIIKENFGHHGLFLKGVREFSKPTFREKSASMIMPDKNNHKRIRLKKKQKQMASSKDRKAISQIS